jgi:hypothetical protein
VHQLYTYLIQQLSCNYQPEKVKNGTLEVLTDAELMNDTSIQVEYHSANAVVCYCLLNGLRPEIFG